MLKTLGEIGSDALSLPHELFAAIHTAAGEIKAAGLTVSAASWVDVERLEACVFSRQCYGPATYNAPKKVITVRVQQ